MLRLLPWPDTTWYDDSWCPPPEPESSFLSPMIPASTRASLLTMRALPARRARPARAMGMKEPAIRRGSSSRLEPFFLLRAETAQHRQQSVRSNFLLHTSLLSLSLYRFRSHLYTFLSFYPMSNLYFLQACTPVSKWLSLYDMTIMSTYASL